DPEARFVRQLDRLDMALQALAYARAGMCGGEEFLASAARALSDPALLDALAAIDAALRATAP
ncbi:MAG TPA: phosphohydrolase, partial [Myxococcota bacterium]|nr:phosphohydrolase [Myxococcota bacterium]